MLAVIALPILVQNGITNFVNLLDNIMVGRLGTEVMSGVSIVNQLLFVLQLLLFGAVSAAGIFTAQYHGTGNTDGVRYTFRFKIIVNLLTAAVGMSIEDVIVARAAYDAAVARGVGTVLDLEN